MATNFLDRDLGTKSWSRFLVRRRPRRLLSAPGRPPAEQDTAHVPRSSTRCGCIKHSTRHCLCKAVIGQRKSRPSIAMRRPHRRSTTRASRGTALPHWRPGVPGFGHRPHCLSADSSSYPASFLTISRAMEMGQAETRLHPTHCRMQRCRNRSSKGGSRVFASSDVLRILRARPAWEGPGEAPVHVSEGRRTAGETSSSFNLSTRGGFHHVMTCLEGVLHESARENA